MWTGNEQNIAFCRRNKFLSHASKIFSVTLSEIINKILSYTLEEIVITVPDIILINIALITDLKQSWHILEINTKNKNER